MVKIIDEKNILKHLERIKESDSYVEEILPKILEDEELMHECYLQLVGIMDGNPVNIDPLQELPTSDMRLYSVDKNYFESIDELKTYCRMNKVSTKELNILDYYRNLAGRSDVIRKSNSKTLMLYTVVDEYGYSLYNNKRSIYCGRPIWEYNHGSIRDLYKPFKEKGIILENDVYGNIDKHNQHILKYVRENSN